MPSWTWWAAKIAVLWENYGCQENWFSNRIGRNGCHNGNLEGWWSLTNQSWITWTRIALWLIHKSAFEYTDNISLLFSFSFSSHSVRYDDHDHLWIMGRKMQLCGFLKDSCSSSIVGLQRTDICRLFNKTCYWLCFCKTETKTRTNTNAKAKSPQWITSSRCLVVFILMQGNADGDEVIWINFPNVH